jgi:hypothetical protein
MLGIMRLEKILLKNYIFVINYYIINIFFIKAYKKNLEYWCGKLIRWRRKVKNSSQKVKNQTKVPNIPYKRQNLTNNRQQTNNVKKQTQTTNS